MKRFTRLFMELDRTTRTNEKVAALRRYFAEAPAADAAWALAVLTGRRIRRAVPGARLREWVAERSGYPLWLVEECYDTVGDLAETLALLLPDPDTGAEPPSLHTIMDEWLAPLPGAEDSEKRRVVERAWGCMDESERLVFHKLLTGGFRVGVGRKLVTRALAQEVGMEPAILAHRLTGRWAPTPETYRRLISPDAEMRDAGRPYPFFLAHPLSDGPEALDGGPEAWMVEWKWDGIRAQLIHRDGEQLLWSRGEEVITPAFPEIGEAAGALPSGTVLDGELLAWESTGPLRFAELQRRLGRKRPGPKIRREVPARFLAYDLLEAEGEDLRRLPQEARRRLLEALFEELGVREPDDGPIPVGWAGGLPLGLSPLVEAAGWEALAELRASARELGVEGFMLKHRQAEYGVGRPRGSWWKWKVEPLTLDVVLLYAQKGHGRRASLYTDYTFGVWDGEELVPIGKAYSGLTDREIRRVDTWIRRNITERFGPVRAVEPELVFELAFDQVRPSTRHKSGLALRFPRMVRQRTDKPVDEADTLESARRLLAERP
ncbi:MAG: ATP-dependent DNA ligase [Gemmatimonadales bacterium]|nr:MAG: ATP-dependent DNA ligase [Gemmatimonadales bacterium]